MDVVKKNLEKVGGKLYVDSKFGEGSVFTIRIPLSLSILDVLSVDVGARISLCLFPQFPKLSPAKPKALSPTPRATSL